MSCATVVVVSPRYVDVGRWTIVSYAMAGAAGAVVRVTLWGHCRSGSVTNIIAGVFASNLDSFSRRIARLPLSSQYP